MKLNDAKTGQDVPAIHFNLPEHLYHGMTEYLSSSRLKQFKRSPLHYHANVQLDTPAMAFGRLVHALIADPAGFLKHNRVLEVSTKTTKAFKQANQEMPGRVFLQKEIDQAFDVVLAIQADHWATKLLHNAELETSFFWREQTRLARARTDVWQADRGIISDFKTVEDASPEAMRRNVIKFGWHLSAEWYRRGLVANGHDFNDWYWIVVEKKPPYAVQVYHCHKDWLDYASASIDVLLKHLAACEAADRWPSYCDGIHELGMPPWLADTL